ncbi:uncharacterized protein DFL_005554 [Arthrobotrys flagrans]|uniref:Uncharacterized protein n=1 Tax=Arthrobotrys flagrans TaxID=97331 RepID=A0A436ZYF6_ARTFL|nr:hypothetical protein DFL_005554 [Arthrobotrys flagrans]
MNRNFYLRGLKDLAFETIKGKSRQSRLVKSSILPSLRVFGKSLILLVMNTHKPLFRNAACILTITTSTNTIPSPPFTIDNRSSHSYETTISSTSETSQFVLLLSLPRTTCVTKLAEFLFLFNDELLRPPFIRYYALYFNISTWAVVALRLDRIAIITQLDWSYRTPIIVVRGSDFTVLIHMISPGSHSHSYT